MMFAMEPERTELTWSYEPADLFEARYERVYDRWRLVVEGGQVLVTIAGGRPPEPFELEVTATVTSLFRARALQTRKRFKLAERANLVELRGEHRNVILRTGVGAIAV